MQYFMHTYYYLSPCRALPSYCDVILWHHSRARTTRWAVITFSLFVKRLGLWRRELYFKTLFNLALFCHPEPLLCIMRRRSGEFKSNISQVGFVANFFSCRKKVDLLGPLCFLCVNMNVCATHFNFSNGSSIFTKLGVNFTQHDAKQTCEVGNTLTPFVAGSWSTVLRF
jgi:hypothetical protein